MTDKKRCPRAATAPACPEKGSSLLTPHHMELIRAAALALHRATKPESAERGAERGAELADWQTAAERLAIALVSRLETIEEETGHD